MCVVLQHDLGKGTRCASPLHPLGLWRKSGIVPFCASETFRRFITRTVWPVHHQSGEHSSPRPRGISFPLEPPDRLFRHPAREQREMSVLPFAIPIDQTFRRWITANVSAHWITASVSTLDPDQGCALGCVIFRHFTGCRKGSLKAHFRIPLACKAQVQLTLNIFQ